MLAVRRALRDILAGAVFIGFGGAFALGALAYDIGTPLRMGPGYVPLALGLITAGLGVAIIIKGFIGGDSEGLTGPDWRPLILISAAIIFFGLTVRGLGVIGALFGTTLLAAFARSSTPWLEAIAIAVGLTVVSVLIFIVALQLRLPLIGPWIPV